MSFVRVREFKCPKFLRRVSLSAAEAFYHLTDFNCTKRMVVLEAQWSKQGLVISGAEYQSCHITHSYANSKMFTFTFQLPSIKQIWSS